jgi:succinyl-diaminopimelate desuccinylase
MEAGRHLVFNGHIDTLLPGNESEWSVPIYVLTEQGDRLDGLGIGKMKAAATALALAFGFLAANRDLWRGRLTFTGVADETKFGPSRAGYLLEARPDLAGDALICGEGPGSMNLAIAERGVCWIEIESRVPTGQGMLSGCGSSAIAQLAAAIGELDALNDLFIEPPAEVTCLSEHAEVTG